MRIIMKRCVVCDDEIYDEEERYELPDGDVVCTSRPCIIDWVDKYRMPGHVIVPYVWVDERSMDN